MPCFGSDYFSTKLVSVFPKNLLIKEPMIYGSVILNDGQTGKPLAVMDGSKLTAMRTAAVGAVGVKHLSPENASTLGVVGLGIQGFHQALFACNDLMALGAVEAIEASGKTGEIVVVGFDALNDAKNAIREGTMDGSVAQYPYEMGRVAVESGFRIINGESVEKYIPVKIELITSKNMN